MSDKQTERKRGWRDVLKIHPAAEMFPLMSKDELLELGENIRKRGLATRVTMFEDKDGELSLLDGRNRLDAMELAGMTIEVRGDRNIAIRGDGPWISECEKGIDPYQFVLSANAHRRHLTPEQKRELIANVLKAGSELSDRQLGKHTKTDHKTVGAVRKKLEAGGEVPHIATRVDARGTRQPASKPVKPVSNLAAEAMREMAKPKQVGLEEAIAKSAKVDVKPGKFDIDENAQACAASAGIIKEAVEAGAARAWFRSAERLMDRKVSLLPLEHDDSLYLMLIRSVEASMRATADELAGIGARIEEAEKQRLIEAEKQRREPGARLH